MSKTSNRQKRGKKNFDSPRDRAINQISPDSITILDCLEIVQNEYNIERNKRQSFETRAGIIITLLAAICVFMFERINLVKILNQFEEPVTIHLLITDLAAIGVYICFGLTLYYAIKTIGVKEYHNFNVSAIDESFMGKPRLEGCIAIIKNYRDIIVQHRQVNANSAKSLSKAFKCMIGIIVCLIIYFNINTI